MIMIGVDPGTRYAGYAVLIKEKQYTRLIECGCWDVHKLGSLVDKITHLYELITNKILEFNVTHIAIETPFLCKNASTFLKLGYVRGILYLIAGQNNLQLFEFSPSEVKKGVTGYGKATKEQVANIIIKLFSIKKPKRDDTSDAIAIALCGLSNKKGSYDPFNT